MQEIMEDVQPLVEMGNHKVVGKVYKTKDYAMFKKIRGNRKVDKFHVFKLTKSILKNNLLEQNPIIVNAEMGIIDGQHRLEVAAANDLWIYYTIAEQGNLEEIQTLNATVKPWQMSDYLESYIALGKREYIKLREYSQKTGLSISNAYLILGGKGDDLDSHGLRSDYKSGNFVITNQEVADKFASFLDDIKAMCEIREWQDRDLIIATMRVMNQIDFNFMIEQYERSGKRIRRQASVRDYLRQYEDIFNYNKQNKTRFY